jgi:hypothetical protein
MFCFFFSQILIFPSEIEQRNSHRMIGRKTLCGARSAVVFYFSAKILLASERFDDLGSDLAIGLPIGLAIGVAIWRSGCRSGWRSGSRFGDQVADRRGRQLGLASVVTT